MGSFTLMVVTAHPDDEALGLGGTLARYAAEGCDVYVVAATRGEAGQIFEPDAATPITLPRVREQELRCACQTYGIHPPIFLDYPDGLLPLVHQGQAVGKLVRLIRRLRPQVVITFGPDGIYGHFDHIAVHWWTITAVDLAADPDWFADEPGEERDPHQVDKLYYRVVAEEQLEMMAQNGRPAAVMRDGVPFRFVGWKQEQITTVIDVSDYVEAKLQGIRCHLTQIGRQSPFFTAPEMVTLAPWFREENFVLARSTVGWPEGVEDDLLAGLRSGRD